MLKFLGAAITLLLVAPAAASAHHVNAAGSSATCSSATTAYESFTRYDNPVTELVYIDTVLTATNTRTVIGSQTFTVTFPYLPNGPHTIRVDATWPTRGSNNGTWTMPVNCYTPPPVVPPPVSPPAAPPVPPAPPVTVTVAPPTTVKSHPKHRTECKSPARRVHKGHRVICARPRTVPPRRCRPGFHHPRHGKHRMHRCVQRPGRPHFTG
jgi:hypothetical protein